MHGISCPVLKTPISQDRRAQKSRSNASRQIPSCHTYHVAQAHGPAVGIVLHQGVVVSGEQRPAADPLRQLLHHRARYGCSVKRGRASAWGHKGTALTLGNTGGTVESIHSSLGATETDTRQTNAAIDLCVCFFSSPLCARQTEWRVRAISGKWPENRPHNNHPPLHCRKNMLLLSWGLLQVILQRKSRKPQLEIG